MSRAVMQQALEALVAAYQGKDKTGQVTEAITALRAALAEPQTTHWEGCEEVHPECRAKTELERKSDAIQRLWKERDELRTLNAGLVGLIQQIIDSRDKHFIDNYADGMWGWDERANAALAKWEASK